MIWQRVSPYAKRTACLRYSVCKVFARGEWIYESWRNKECIGTHPSAAAAQEQCERDSQKSEAATVCAR